MNPDAYIGQSIDLDGAYGAQCFDFANFWSQKLGYGRFTGLKASGIYGQQPENYTWVANTPDGVPPMGAIVVWDDGINGTVGHVAVARAGSDTNVLRTDDQNWGVQRVIAVDHNYNHVIGWGIPKGNASNVTPQGGEDVIVNDDNNYARANKTHLDLRGRPLDRSVFNAFVGKPWLTFIETCEDDPEADNWQHFASVGAVAVRDAWDKQIYSLQDQLKAANDALAAAKQKPVDLPPVKVEPPTQGFTPAPVPVPVESPAKPNQSIFDTLIEAILSLFSKGKK